MSDSPSILGDVRRRSDIIVGAAVCAAVIVSLAIWWGNWRTAIPAAMLSIYVVGLPVRWWRNQVEDRAAEGVSS